MWTDADLLPSEHTLCTVQGAWGAYQLPLEARGSKEPPWAGSGCPGWHVLAPAASSSGRATCGLAVCSSSSGAAVGAGPVLWASPSTYDPLCVGLSADFRERESTFLEASVCVAFRVGTAAGTVLSVGGVVLQPACLPAVPGPLRPLVAMRVRGLGFLLCRGPVYPPPAQSSRGKHFQKSVTKRGLRVSPLHADDR